MGISQAQYPNQAVISWLKQYQPSKLPTVLKHRVLRGQLCGFQYTENALSTTMARCRASEVLGKHHGVKAQTNYWNMLVVSLAPANIQLRTTSLWQ